jgi:hypothetical protein
MKRSAREFVDFAPPADWNVPVTEDTATQAAGLRSARQVALLIIGLAGVFAIGAPASLTFLNTLLGLLLLVLTLWPWVRWFQLPQRRLPWFETLNLHLFAVYVPPIFLAEIVFEGVGFSHHIAQSTLTTTLLLLVLGVGAFQGVFLFLQRQAPAVLRPRHFDVSRLATGSLLYLALAAFGPILLPQFPGSLAKLSHLLFQVNAGVATYLLSAQFHAGRLSSPQRTAFHGILAVFLILSLASGWLTFAVFPVYCYLLADVQLRKRIPWLSLAAVALGIVAFNATKSAFREIYWGEHMGGDRITSLDEGFSRATDWFRLTVEEEVDLVEAPRETLITRLNNLAFLAHVVRWTPDRREHLGWSTYATVPAMFIPRLVWPDKPSVMLVANEIAVSYGALAEWQVGKVALDIGLFTEAYIAFGLFGGLLMGAFLGLFTGLLTRWLGQPHDGLFRAAPLVAMLCGGALMITWSLQNFLGGLWQAAFVAVVLYLPFRAREGEAAEASGTTPSETPADSEGAA